MIDPLKVWTLHRAILLHFTSKYDIFEYNGKVKNCTEEAFEKRKDRKIFINLAKEFDHPPEAIDFFLANYIYNAHDDTYDQSVCWDNLKKWQGHRQRMTQLIIDEVENFSPTDILGNPPQLLQDVVSGIKTPMTAVAINRHMNFSEAWVREHYFALHPFSLIIDKLDKFVKYNVEKVNQVIEEKLYADA